MIAEFKLYLTGIETPIAVANKCRTLVQIVPYRN